MTVKINGTSGLLFEDGILQSYGDDNDLQINHDGSNSYINDAGTGNLRLQTGGSTKLEVTSSGIDVTGTVTADGLTVDGDVLLNDNVDLHLVRTHSNGGTNLQYGEITFGDTTSGQYVNHAKITSYGLYANNSDLRFHTSQNTNSPLRLKIDVNGDISFYEDTGTTAKLFWDASAESLGIGTTSPTSKLDCGNTGNNSWVVNARTNGTSKVSLGVNSDYGARLAGPSDVTGAVVSFGEISVSDGSSYTERMRIDSYGNLLVGKTSTGVSNTGFEARENGFSNFSRDAATVVQINRQTSDGEILKFSKDGTAVGNISTYAGDITVGTGDTAVRYDDNADSFIPWNTSTNSSRDAGISLGASNVRYKDLYLSGGVYLGGTGSANYLDDYEEGTFSGTVNGSVYEGTYTKIGRMCHISINIDNTSSTGTAIASLPFSSKNGGTPFNGNQPTLNTSRTENNVYVAPYNGGTTLYMYSSNGNTLNVSTGLVRANFVYETG